MFKRRSERKPPDITPVSIGFSVEQGKKLSRGGLFGKGIHEATVFLDQDKERKHGRTLVVKQYTHSLSPQRTLERLKKIHTTLREGKFKVPVTFRIDSAKHQTIMTNFNRTGFVTLSCNNESDFMEEASVNELTGFESVLERLTLEAIRAGKAGYTLPTDAYFLILSQVAKEDIDFVIGDLDNVSQGTRSQEDAIRFNISEAKSFFEKFLFRWVTEKERPQYLDILKRFFNTLTPQ